MIIRRSEAKDINTILNIYQIARERMKKNGNMNQWKDDRPTFDDLVIDINHSRNYVVIEEDTIIGTFTFFQGIDETYNYIEGSWPNNEEYGVIHKIAALTEGKHILDIALNYGARMVKNIRIDTHEDNKIMRHLLEKYGFSYCGIIYLKSGDKRMAFAKKYN